jgi:alpha-1,2-mannosyltransferase
MRGAPTTRRISDVAERARVATRLAQQLPPIAKRRSTERIAIVLALFVCAWAFDAAFAVRHGFFDLRVYYGALNYWADGHGELYDYLLPRSKYGFTYPPFAALTMLPMAYLGWHVAIVISMLMTALAAVAVLYWLVAPIARRHRWNRWYVLAIAAAFAIAFEPLRETFLFGQVNALLLVLVAADLLLLVRYNRSIAGVGIGLATAIKLTPGIFIVYLIITRRYRAAAVASGTTLAATLLAGAVVPDASREFWTDALWNTSRVGSQSFVSNQSLNGMIHRWDPQHPSKLVWLALVLLVLAIWAWRSRRAVRHGDEVTGLALTGIVGVLISPITWVHHLVWVLPAIVLLVDRGLVPGLSRRRRWWLLGLAGVTYAVMCSRLVWAFNGNFDSFFGWLGSNSYVWLSLILLVAVPIATKVAPAAVPRIDRPTLDAPDAAELDRQLAVTIGAKPLRVPAQDEGTRRLVGADQ